MNILAIHPRHDASICLRKEDEIFYSKFERYTQIKHDGPIVDNPLHGILNAGRLRRLERFKAYLEHSFKAWGVTYDDIEILVVTAGPVPSGDKRGNWPQKLKGIRDGGPRYTKHSPWNRFKCPIKTVEHHFAHCYSYFPHTKADVDFAISIDGLGDNVNVFVIDLNTREVLDRRDMLTSPHCTIAWVLNDIGKSVMGWNSGHLDWAGKLMGLQGYGKDMGVRLTKESLMSLPARFSPFGNLLFRPLDDDELSSHWPIANGQKLYDFLYTFHKQYAADLVEYMRHFFDRRDRIYFAGGVSLNVVVNDVLRQHFPNIIINPHGADEGLSFGMVEIVDRFDTSARNSERRSSPTQKLPNLHGKRFIYNFFNRWKRR